MMRITILGCGSSGGVPLIGCKCKVCTSTNPKNKRSRVSIVVEDTERDTRLMVDTSPDLREQALRNHINKIDGIIYTHDHADHTHGIDDVRSFNYAAGKPLDIWASADTLEGMNHRFHYAFKEPVAQFGWFRPSLVPNLVENHKPFMVKNMTVVPFEQVHGDKMTLGLRMGDFAYSTDVKEMPEASFDALRGVKIWVVDCLKYTPAPTHAHLALALEWIKRAKPERAILTHMSHDFDYDRLKAELPAHIEPAYDGMVLEL